MAHLIAGRGARRLHLFAVACAVTLELIAQRDDRFAKLPDLIGGIRNGVLDRLLSARAARFELLAHSDNRFPKLLDLALPGGYGVLDRFLTVHNPTIIEVRAVTPLRIATPPQAGAPQWRTIQLDFGRNV